ncbi:TPA: hypothetical protein GX533_00275 [Candidatus Dojkabacteria bacterium]|uniref:Uncharacterized protein n=1 Tax=Candidatus Dojkabacteria bacterium TaxID=2099670 RepID=A0A832QD66_9BACT|nr:hypothetical protein [Candidatus Dojkabacteria bacterium]
MKGFLKKLWYIFRQRYGQILLVILLILISFLSIRWGQHLISNDNYSPELNPWMSVQRYLESPAWRSYRVLGFASDSEQADIFRSIFFGISDLFLPNELLAQLFSLFCLCVGTLSMATLVSQLVRDKVNTKSSGYIFFFAGLIYLSSLWTAWVFNFNMMPYIAQYGFLPLVLLTSYWYMKDPSHGKSLLLFIASLLFVSTAVIGTLFFVNIVLITAFLIYFGWNHRVRFKGILKGLGIFLIVQLFWLLPFGQYAMSTSGNIIDSYTNRSITANTIDLEKEMMTLPNSARLYTRLLGTVDNPENNTYIFPPSSDYMEYDFYKVVGLLPFFLSMVGLVFIIAQKKYSLLPLYLLLFGLLFLLKNQNPPLGEIYIWLQENLGIFKQVFRWISSKVGQQYLIVLTFTSTIGFALLLNFLASFFKKVSRYIFILFSLAIVVLPLFFYSEYLFRGYLFTQRATVNLPEQYFELKEALKTDPYSRIYYAPPSNNGYFREYDWGFVGSQFISYIIPNPVMDMSLAIGSDVGEVAMWEIRNVFDAGDRELFLEKMQKYDVGYILVDRSVVKGRYGHALNWESMENIAKGLELVWEKDFLALYKINKKDVRYVEYLGTSDSLPVGSFTRDVQQEPRIVPMNLPISSPSLTNGYLSQSVEYSGIPVNLYSNIAYSDINNAPIHVKKYGDRIRVSPALPILNGITNDTYKEFLVDDEGENFYIIDGYVLDDNSVAEGVSLTSRFGEITSVFFVKASSMREEPLTDVLAHSQPGDCSGGEYAILPDVKKETIASGFKLEGFTELPCLYVNIRLDKRLTYVGTIDVNWEPSSNTTFGFCLYSAKEGICVNREKFFSTDSGYGNISILLPRPLRGSDDLSLTIYASNPLSEKASVNIRNIDINLSGAIQESPVFAEYIDTQQKVLELGGERRSILVELPVLYGNDSYIYSNKDTNNAIWETSKAEDGSLSHNTKYEDGMKQVVQNQRVNQYAHILQTTPAHQYLWYWKGENLKNIPASLCLTYQGSDRCWVDDILYTDEEKSVLKTFLSPAQDLGVMDASYNSISFADLSENILKQFVVMPKPEVWDDAVYKAAVEREYHEVELVPRNEHGSLYTLGEDQELSRNTLISIPQAKSKYWFAVAKKDDQLKIFGKEDRVDIKGWKQGWDTEGKEYDSVIVIYWPNLLSYFGYLLIIIMFVYLIVKIVKQRKYGFK